MFRKYVQPFIDEARDRAQEVQNPFRRVAPMSPWVPVPENIPTASAQDQLTVRWKDTEGTKHRRTYRVCCEDGMWQKLAEAKAEAGPDAVDLEATVIPYPMTTDL